MDLLPLGFVYIVRLGNFHDYLLKVHLIMIHFLREEKRHRKEFKERLQKYAGQVSPITH